MSIPIKIGLGFAGLVGVSGGGYLGFKLLSTKETLRSKYSLAVDGFLSDTTVVDKKIKTLGGDSSDPKHPDLKEAKQKNKNSETGEAKQAFEKGCKLIYEESIDSQYFDDFKKYCSFNNEDKIASGKILVSQATDFNNHWTSFSGKTEAALQAGFKDIHRTKGSNIDETWKGKMLGECKRLSIEIFTGEIPNFKDYCTKNGVGG